MLDYFLSHLFQYFLILLIFLTSMPSLVFVENRAFKITTVFTLSSLYFLWGIAHHLEEKNLTKAIVFEYLAMALLILWVLMNVI